MANEQAPKVTVRIDNAASVRRLMRDAAPDLLKEIDKANREAAKPILAYAKSIVPNRAPISGWAHAGRTGWDSGKVAKGMVLRAGKRSSFSDYRSLLEFRQTNAAGAIFEVLGRRGQPKTEKGRRFLDVINKRYPRVSRLLWRAVDDMGLNRLQNEIVQNYRSFEAKLNARLENASGN
jgi:hypothetical protein